MQHVARRKAKLASAVLRGRARRWLRRNELLLAVVSVLCMPDLGPSNPVPSNLGCSPPATPSFRVARTDLGLVFMQIVMEETPLSPHAAEESLIVFATIDLAFLIIFSFEHIASLLAYGRKHIADRLIAITISLIDVNDHPPRFVDAASQPGGGGGVR